MKPWMWRLGALLMAIALVPAPARARGLSVEVSTDRGHEAVYQPGQSLEIKTRTSEDAYLLVYEIDAEGYLHVLYPHLPEENGWVEGGATYRLPEGGEEELVAQGPTGQGYIVAIASSDRLLELPWYLRPYDARAQEIGYHGAPEGEWEEEGVTAEGRIVGDPFVAMERIRRRVLANPDDDDSFASAYTSYYIHERVRYPRYLCNDCHRPGQWTWWDGYDPYYTQCSVFDLRVNWGWRWGRPYWLGYVPYYVYVYRPDCPPGYRHFGNGGRWHSSWDGWKRWRTMWGGHLARYKPAPPPGYVPPSKYDNPRGRIPGPRPPGFMAGDPGRSRTPRQVPIGKRSGIGDPLVGDEPRTPKRMREPDPIGDPGGRMRRGDGAPDPGAPSGRKPRYEPSRPSRPSEPQARPARERRMRDDWRAPAPQPVMRPSRERTPPPPEPVARPSRERTPPPPEPQARPSRDRADGPKGGYSRPEPAGRSRGDVGRRPERRRGD